MSDGEPIDLDEAAMEEALREAEAIATELESNPVTDQTETESDVAKVEAVSVEDKTEEKVEEKPTNLAADYIKEAAEEPASVVE